MISSLFALSDDDESHQSLDELTFDGDEDEDSDDGECIGEGECELCERHITLTRHHLIPRSTWPRITPRLTNAVAALSRNDFHRASLILGPGLAHLTDPLTRVDASAIDKDTIKWLLQRTCNICRPCHSTIHKTHGNMALATSFSTIKLLLEDEKIYNFAKYASKQKTGQHSVKK